MIKFFRRKVSLYYVLVECVGGDPRLLSRKPVSCELFPVSVRQLIQCSSVISKKVGKSNILQCKWKNGEDTVNYYVVFTRVKGSTYDINIWLNLDSHLSVCLQFYPLHSFLKYHFLFSQFVFCNISSELFRSEVFFL